MAIRLTIPRNTYGRRGTRLHTDELGFLGQEASGRSVEGTEAFGKTLSDEVRHPLMEGTWGQPHRIGGRGQRLREAPLHEVRHPLSGRPQATLGGDIAPSLELLTPVHQGKWGSWIFDRNTRLGDILRVKLDDHPRVRPAGATVGRRHTIHYRLLWTRRSGHDEAPRAHTEAIDTSSPDLRLVDIFGGR